MGLFRAAHGWGGEKKAPLPEIFHTCPTIMKLGKVTPYLKIYMVNIIVFFMVYYDECFLCSNVLSRRTGNYFDIPKKMLLFTSIEAP